ncbi:MAG: ABC transporter ATP-binding protein [Phycisphaerae bacterium]|nr:ABC transporter ATP-binding protein [Phycisphaerae bacterium]
MTATEWAIDLADVDKVYRGRVHALRGINMRVARGEIFGLLGPNGAGKSTLVKILMTVVKPTRCRGSMLGQPVGHKPTLARVGYLPEHHRFPDYLTGRQVVEFYGGLCGVPRTDRRRRAAELVDLVGMHEWADARVKSYSKGMRQRVGIAQALVNDPDLVLLDEPTDGVDPVGRREIRQVLTHVKAQGKAVLLNSHLLSELEMVCDRVSILVQGSVASQGTIDELTRGKRRYEIELAPGDEPAAAVFRAALPDVFGADPDAAGVGTLPGGHTARLEGPALWVDLIDPRDVQWLIDAVRARGGVIRAVRQVRPSLEDLFMEAVTDPRTGKTLDVGAAKDAPGRRRRARP